MKVSFVIPNYNGEEILKKNLPRVIEAAAIYAKSSENKTEIIVVDDYSRDNSLDVINSVFREKSYAHVSTKLLVSPVNKGFSSTVNKGAAAASGEILILLNTDAYPEKKDDFFSKALEHFEDPDMFAVGFMDRSVEGKSVVMRGRGVGRWKKGFLIHRRGEVDKVNTLWVSGGSSAFRKSIWEKLGGMNELYNPFYWEDIDLSYRAQKRGYKILFEPRSIVVHEHEKGAIKKSRKPFVIQTISYRNQLQFVWLNATDRTIILSHIFWLPFHMVNTLLKGDAAFLLGFLKAIVRLPAILQKRASDAHSVILSDKKVVESFSSEKIE